MHNVCPVDDWALNFICSYYLKQRIRIGSGLAVFRMVSVLVCTCLVDCGRGQDCGIIDNGISIVVYRMFSDWGIIDNGILIVVWRMFSDSGIIDNGISIVV